MESQELTRVFRRSSPRATVCEILRLINDECQEDNAKDERIREHLVKAMVYVKKMNSKLIEYKKDYDEGWWKNLPKGHKEKLNKVRQDAGYKCLE